jgi:hypothetical protein
LRAQYRNQAEIKGERASFHPQNPKLTAESRGGGGGATVILQRGDADTGEGNLRGEKEEEVETYKAQDGK